MATSGKDREARERARVYQARQQLHDDQARRRRRDNLLAGVIGGAVILGVLGAQAAYFMVGPGAPEPVPTRVARPRPRRPSPTDAPSPTTEPTPSPPHFLTLPLAPERGGPPVLGLMPSIPRRRRQPH